MAKQGLKALKPVRVSENSGRSLHHSSKCFAVLVETWDLDPKMLKIRLKVFNIFPLFEVDAVSKIFADATASYVVQSIQY